ncbi:MAG: UDP-N-acetylmuramoyl-L-alanyl-D-glutamate--2,6-diaminopimelate ligase [Acidobacteriaceae bacterium]|jgi:UDP-N-acetylmuramoyl-L-alanyl-D-glutamate--2,6-diaminopimelate ligase|nr:UDP-N-acetylmuramoyl-L-alanyl-D-glutamate--2,6-diaminopimelate ligase [Acidobacteriaceae bacterium]
MTWNDCLAVLRAHDLLSYRGTDSARAGECGQATVTGIACDSRRVTAGNVFVALLGQHDDGVRYATEAVARGAVAVVAAQPAPGTIDVAWLVVSDARRALALLAAEHAGHPSRAMRVVGITGTNGKTTTAYLTASMFDAAGIPCGLVGTVGYRIGQKMREATHTTPEATEVQSLFREMVDAGCGACAMEVSSHALSLHRVDGVRFAAGVFTNLTRDHLDFHADMEAYFQAKRRLFDMLPDDAPSVINLDDPRGATLADVAKQPVTYAISRPADVTPGPLSFSLRGLSFDVRTPRGTLQIQSSLVGRPNVYNILASVATASSLGLPLPAIEQGVATLDGVPGRFQVVSSERDDVTVVVDYAHTDDALRNLLETARPLAQGRLLTVFGCGGDRDRTKRPLMGAVAGRLSDVIIITSDNPRSEDPARIIEEVQRGITPDTRRDSAQRILAIVDRREAIDKAIALARAGDLVLIAGKGHEKNQVIGREVFPFDDAAVAHEALDRKRSNSGVS